MTSCLKPRFKGIENLLKRIAFNLGNSPSQTEVKIISCVPIDVTDLQNKIIELEKELDDRAAEAEENALLLAHQDQQRRTQENTQVNTALTGAPVLAARPATPDPSTSSYSQSSQGSTNSEIRDAPADEHTQVSNGRHDTDSDKSEEPQAKIKKMGRKKSNNKTHLIYYAETETNSPFTDANKEPQADTRPRVEEEEETSVTERAYLADMVRRQYRPERLGADTSTGSHFSSPVCRDEPGGAPLPEYDPDGCSCCHGHFHDLDATVRDPGFIHIDPYTPDPLTQRNHSTYYDSNLYDVIPVKERPMKITKNVYEIREKPYEQEYPYDENFVNQFRSQPRNQSYIVNYNYRQRPPPSPMRYNHKNAQKRKLPLNAVHKREQVLRAMQKRKLEKVAEDSSQSCTVECGNVYEKLYPSRTAKNQSPPPLPPQPPPRTVLLRNAECLTMSMNDTECQTATSRSVQLEPPPPDENKTEIALNQIKSILHAVLTEVKTSAQGKNILEGKSTKDVFVQKDNSQSNVAARSSLMNSYLYSPYNITPYGASCSFSSPAAGSQLVYPPLSGPAATMPPPVPPPMPAPSTYPPLKCQQHYPLFIHTTGRQCTCCYRSNPAPVPRVPPAAANTAHTVHNVKALDAAHTSPNTNTQREASKKQNTTEKLIKEIYKSLAVNMDYPKETSRSDCLEETSSQNTTNTTSQKIEFRMEPKARKVPSEAVKNTDVQGSSLFSTEAIQARMESQDASFRSEQSKTTTTTTTTTTGSKEDSRRAMDRLRNLLATKELLLTGSDSTAPTQQTPSTPQRRQVYMPANNNASTDSEDDEETPSSDEVDSDATVVVQTEKKKGGLFSKMKKLFTSRPKRRRRKNTSSVPDATASDSDDYETVYSQKSQRDDRGDRRDRRISYAPRPAPPASRTPPPRTRSRAHSKVAYARQYAPRRETMYPRQKTSPYMEQEYRRYWDEKLMFHGGDTPRYSSERPVSRESDRGPRRPPYWREYEARAALVDSPALTAQARQLGTQGQNTQTISAPAENSKVIPPRAARSDRSLPWYKKLRCAPDWKRILLEG